MQNSAVPRMFELLNWCIKENLLRTCCACPQLHCRNIQTREPVNAESRYECRMAHSIHG